MNAKGLFKKLKDGLPIESKWDLVVTIDKQEKRIAELEKECNRLSDHASELRKLHADRIAELEKYNNEPVGWYNKKSNDYFIDNAGQPDFQVEEFIEAGYIPLYTRPSKQLSDKEIEEWLDVYGMDMGDVYEINKVRFVQAVRAIIKEMNK